MSPVPLRRAHVGCSSLPRVGLAAVVALAVRLALGAPELAALVPADIGAPAIPGSTTVRTNTVEIIAGGKGIGFKSDQFHFASVVTTGDFDVQVRVADLGASDLWARAGLMLRQSAAPDAPFAAVFTTPCDAGCFFQARATSGGTSTNTGSLAANQPFTWLRLRRADSTVTGYAGYDGRRWTTLGSRSLAFGTSPLLGLAVTSHATNGTTRAEFRDLTDVRDPIAGLLPTGVEPPGPTSRRTALVVSEILYHPAPRDNGRKLEFIELHNTAPYFEDLSGWRLEGDIAFTFPPGTRIPGGGFLVVAAAPADLEVVYGLTGVLGPFAGRLDNQGGRIRLTGEHGAVFLDLAFDDRPPWPKLPDGAGHSLVLTRPSFGEADARAWSASRLIGGSPGRPEAIEVTGLAGLRLNECQFPSPAGAGFVELFNASPLEADLAGVRLGASPDTLPFVLSAGTRLAPGAFLALTWAELGFRPKPTGDTLYLKAADGSRFLDAVTFAPQWPGTSAGRWPNGGETIQTLPSPTPGAGNAHPQSDVVINEIHLRPITGARDEDFVELFNRGSTAIDLGGWAFVTGLEFVFPGGTSLPAGGYLVVAHDTNRFFALHPDLGPNRVLGNYRGRLSPRGDRLTLSRPLDLGDGKSAPVLVPVTSATSAAGGRWSRWADAGGSSLERTDPRANPDLNPSWAASDESARGAWTTVEFRGVLDNGAASVRPDSLHVYLMGEGECLIDNVEVLGPGNTNRLANGTFETGTNGWVFSGNHVQSSLESGTGDNSGRSLHLRATGNGDTGANKIFAKLTSPLANGNTATLRARVKWLRGWPEILLRLHGNYLEAYGRLDTPAAAGTPGARNSRAVDNAGPAIDQVAHFPAVPAVAEPVLVTARVDDPDGVRTVRLRYRTDPDTTRTSIELHDDGTGGDGVAGDGIYSALLPAPGTARLIAFTLEATDGAAVPASSVFPPGAPAKECLVRFGDPMPSGAFGTYRLWVTQATSDVWRARPILSNEPLDATFVYDNARVVYGAGARFAGSPFHQQFTAGPASDAHFVVNVPQDERVIGTTAFNKIHAPGNSPFDDAALQREQVVNWFARKMDAPWLHRRFVHVVVNGVRKRTLMEDTQVGSDDFVEEFWPQDSDGDLFKLQPWFEFPDSTSQNLNMQQSQWLTFNRFTTTGGVLKTARYRCNWLVRGADGTANTFTNVFNLVTAATDFTNPRFEPNLEQLADIDEWFRIFAINHAVGNWDSVGYRNGQNTYAYKPARGPWQLAIWDANIVLGNGSDGPAGLPLFTASDATLSRWFTSTGFRRRLRSAYFELANGPMQAAAVGPLIDAKFGQFQEHGVTASTGDTIKTWINSARANILTQLARDTAPFAVTNVTGTNLVVLSGTGPLDMIGLAIDGTPVALTWSSTKTWTATYSPAPQSWKARVTPLNRQGLPLASGPQEIVLTAPGNLAIQPATTGWSLEYPASHRGTYRLETTTHWSPAEWITVESRLADPGPLRFLLPTSSEESRFYRVVEE